MIDACLYSHTVILSDWTFRKWGLSNFAVQHCYKFIGTITKRIFEILWGILEIIQFILSNKHLDGAGQSLRIFWKKSKNDTLIAPQMKSFGQKKNLNSMHRSKSAILAIFQTGPGWPCTVSAALKNPSQDFKNSFCIGCQWIPINAGMQN